MITRLQPSAVVQHKRQLPGVLFHVAPVLGRRGERHAHRHLAQGGEDGFRPLNHLQDTRASTWRVQYKYDCTLSAKTC